MTDHEPFCRGFLSFVIGTAQSIAEARWDDYFDAAGIAQELRDSIMDPYFADIRGTEGPKYWVANSLEVRFDLLRLIGDRIGEHVRAEAAIGSASGSSPRLRGGA